MIFLAFLLHLSFFILITVVIGIYANTTIQLLLVVIVVVFLQGLILLSLGNSIIGSYIIIIYIGAIVILFAFCILFINTKELVKENKKNLNPNQSLKGVKIMFFLFLILTWELGSSFITSTPLKSNLNSFFTTVSETNYMLYFSQQLYSELYLPLFLMVLILILGLIITIKILKKN